MKTEKDWTIMVYMAGDNNLSENMAFSVDDILTSVTSSRNMRDKINILTFFDGNSLTAPTFYTDFSDATEDNPPINHAITTKDIYHKSRKPKFPEDTPKELLVDGNSASAYSIMNFVRWCLVKKKRTAKNYAIIFSGHSFGFHGTSFLRDEDSGGFLTLFKFRWALEKVTQLYLKKKIDILGFDSCVMSMLEIGYELKDVAQTIIASEGSLPNSGWSYSPMLKSMIENFNTKINKIEVHPNYFASNQYVKDIAKGFVESFIINYRKLVIGGRSIDISSWDLEKIEPLTIEVNHFSQELKKFLYLVDKVQSDKLDNIDIRNYHELKKILLQAHYDTQTYMQDQCIDLKDFCKRLFIELKLIEQPQKNDVFRKLKNHCKKIIALVDDCVLKSGFCGDEYQFSNGISLYFPWSYLTFKLTNYRYRYLRINRGVNNYDLKNPIGEGKEWHDFLFNYLTRVTIRLTRKRLDENGNEYIPSFENFSKDSPIWDPTFLHNKDNPVWNKDNPRASRDNPMASKDNPMASKDNPMASKDNPMASKGELGDYLFYFKRFKNYDLRWDISGFANEFPFESQYDFDDANENNKD